MTSCLCRHSRADHGDPAGACVCCAHTTQDVRFTAHGPLTRSSVLYHDPDVTVIGEVRRQTAVGPRAYRWAITADDGTEVLTGFAPNEDCAREAITTWSPGPRPWVATFTTGAARYDSFHEAVAAHADADVYFRPARREPALALAS